MRARKEWKVLAVAGETEGFPPELLGLLSEERRYLLECTSCGNKAYRTEDEMRLVSRLCPCRTSRKEAIYLEAYGLTLTMSDWASLFGLKVNSIRSRYFKRKHSNSNASDQEVVFGKSFARVKSKAANVAGFEAYALAEAKKALEKVAEKLTTEIFLPTLKRAAMEPDLVEPTDTVKSGSLAGSKYKIEVVGLTVSECVETVGIQQTVSFLMSETFPSQLEKEARLLPFIPLLDLSSDVVTQGEAMQLLSIVR